MRKARESNPWQLVEAPGLQTLLHTGDFGAWEGMVASTLGHHHSRLMPRAERFEALMRMGSLDEFQVLLLRGHGQIELIREQCGHAVLWLPLQGLTQEIINGAEYLAEPGMALFFQPGDAMEGHTSEAILGISILIPPSYLQGIAPPSPLLDRGAPQRQLIHAAHQLAQAVAWHPRGARYSADLLIEELSQWLNSHQPGQHSEQRIGSLRRRDLVMQACQWMGAHLSQRFTVQELSQSLGVSVRSLQYAFQDELGHTPMAEAKRLRLRHLRHLLRQPTLRDQRIAALMESSGLLACGSTAADYRHWCGESPSKTRMKDDA